VTAVNLNLAASGGVGDGQADTVTVDGTAGEDVIQAVGDSSGAAVFGLAAQVNVTGAEPNQDQLVINGQDGDDVIDGTGLAAGAIQLVANGGNGNDILLGGADINSLFGGDGDDVLIGGTGSVTLDGGNGDNVVIR
jgi:Ca2+-binding RTX toxin-like protein